MTESTLQLGKDFEELSEKYIGLSERYKKITELYDKEKKLNDELIIDMTNITKNTSKISDEFMKLSKKHLELLGKTEHGIYIEYEDREEEFYPVMANLDKIFTDNKIKRVRYTFLPDEIKKWFKDVEVLTASDLEKIVYVKKDEE